MRFSILLGLLPLALTMVDAKCFKRGTIGNKRVPENNLQEICAGLAGTYDSEMAPRRICVHEDGDSTSWYFATRRRKGKGYMAPLECTTWLGAEINGCEFGGQSKVGDWWVRLVLASILFEAVLSRVAPTLSPAYARTRKHISRVLTAPVVPVGLSFPLSSSTSRTLT